MNKQQTSVEWLENELEIVLPILEKEEFRFFKEAIEQAKALEKQQIIDAHKNGEYLIPNSENAELYYQETFKK